MKSIRNVFSVLLALMFVVCSVVPVYADDLKDLANAIVVLEDEADYEYDGTEQEPDVVVTYDNIELVRGVDYIVNYYNNINVGTATVTVTAIEGTSYIGSKSITFNIVPEQAEEVTAPNKVTISSVYNSTKKNYIVVEWKTVSCDKYQIMYSTDSSFSKSVKTVTVNNCYATSTKISVKNYNKKYYVKVRAVNYDQNGKALVGPWSGKLTNQYSKVYASYSSKYVNNKNRTTNLKIASKAIDGTVIAPGETFSFNDVVGKRTEAKGYKKAHVFNGANETTMGTGGGICQVASTMFNAALLANLKIVERHQHSQRVAYVPLGRDAAIYWPSQNFRFKNNTKYPIMIKMTVKDGTITCKLLTSQAVKPKKVSIKVSRSGNNFTMKRSVGGKVNYTAKSHY